MISCPSGGKSGQVSAVPVGASWSSSRGHPAQQGMGSGFWAVLCLCRAGSAVSSLDVGQQPPQELHNFPSLGTCSISNASISLET